MKLTVRASAAQLLGQLRGYKPPHNGGVFRANRPAPQLLSGLSTPGSHEVLCEQRSNRNSHYVDDLHPRSLWRSRYGHGEFDEREHPRAPAGRSDGGQFVSKNGGTGSGTPLREFFVPENLRAYRASQRATYDNIPNLTTAELQSDLHDRTRSLVLATSTEDREYAELWIHRLNHELQLRDFSDEKASLKVKERLWKAQHKFTLLQQEYRRLNTWLEQSRLTIWKSSESVRAARQKLADVKRQLVEQARITGSTLPHDNPIRNWTFEQKLAAVADRILKSGTLAPEIHEQLKAAVRPENLARMCGMIALLAAAHAFPPAGLAADATLLAFGGTESALIAHRLYLEVSSIQDEADLKSAAKVLEEELASNAAGKLIQRLTGAALKGVKKPHNNRAVAVDRKKVRVNANGEIPQKPNSAHPPVVPGKRKRPTTEKSKKALKPALPKAVTSNQAKHRRMLNNQQKELTTAIDNAPAELKPTVRGQTLHEQGMEYQKLSDKTIEQISDAEFQYDQSIGIGIGSEIDNIIVRGEKKVYVESKFTIQELPERTINQLTNATRTARPGDTVILNVARKPTDKELLALRNALPAGVFDQIRIVSSQIQLFRHITSALEETTK